MNIKHKGEQIFSPGEYIISTKEGFKEILTTFNYLEILKTTTFGSPLYEEINEVLLNYIDSDEELKEALHKVCNNLYEANKKKGISSFINMSYDKEKIIENYYGYGSGHYFLKKDINFLKSLEKKEIVTSSYGGSTTYGYIITVEDLNIFDKEKKILITYTGEIQIFQDNNKLGFGIYKLRD